MLNTKVRKSIVFLTPILRVGGYTVLANLVFIGICILKKVRKSIFILYAKGDLRTFEVLGGLADTDDIGPPRWGKNAKFVNRFGKALKLLICELFAIR